ncbi:MAG TPA: ABC transporter ATP-binding protein [archaeon]|nr:ABC transporter ATP-binding protein [archaeon]
MALKKLVISNVSKNFEAEGLEKEVLDGITLSVEEGESVCLIGPNACGKSTLLQIVAGLIEPTKGKILHNGELVDEPHCSRTIIFQDLNLFPWKTISENIEFGLRAKGVEEASRGITLEKYLNLLKIQEFANYYPNQLSGGTKQKSAIARALAMEPDILLMDEPFSSLDMQTREFLQEELQKIVREKNQTTLFVSHSIDEALILADRIVVLSNSPARIKSVVKVLRKHKENPDFRHSEDFLRYRKHISKLLKEE